ncbi:hypothetical protein C4G84_RS23615 [Vibrio parahaemolyticus O5:K30]|nr:hypothetical protein [Vibrio parahaemolyticus O5:K30]
MNKLALFGHLLPNIDELYLALPESSPLKEKMKKYIELPTTVLSVTVCSDGDFKLVIPEHLSNVSGVTLVNESDEEDYKFGIPVYNSYDAPEVFLDFMKQVEIISSRESRVHQVQLMIHGAYEAMKESLEVEYCCGNFSLYVDLLKDKEVK